MTPLELGFFAIPVLDVPSAKAFYGETMGWSFSDRDPAFSYILANDNMIGSLELASEKTKPSMFGPLLFFRADSMDQTLARVKANGGTVVEVLAMEEGGRGFTAKILDLSGNCLGFWAPEK